MYAVLYSDTAGVKQLLDAGADPNTRNDSDALGVTGYYGFRNLSNQASSS